MEFPGAGEMMKLTWEQVRTTGTVKAVVIAEKQVNVLVIGGASGGGRRGLESVVVVEKNERSGSI